MFQISTYVKTVGKLGLRLSNSHWFHQDISLAVKHRPLLQHWTNSPPPPAVDKLATLVCRQNIPWITVTKVCCTFAVTQITCYCCCSPLDDAPDDVVVPDDGLVGVLVLVWELAPPAAEPAGQASQRLGRGQDVERRGQRGARLEVADPQLRPGKLPLPGETQVRYVPDIECLNISAKSHVESIIVKLRRLEYWIKVTKL